VLPAAPPPPPSDIYAHLASTLPEKTTARCLSTYIYRQNVEKYIFFSDKQPQNNQRLAPSPCPEQTPCTDLIFLKMHPRAQPVNQKNITTTEP